MPDPDQLPVLIGFTRTRELADAELAGLLSAAEQRRAEAIRHAGNRQQFIGGRWLLRQMLRRNGLPQPEIVLSELGKPRLGNCGGWRFNLAHADELIACVLSRAECGIDVEAILPVGDMAELLASHFAGEWAWWRSQHGAVLPPDEEFYRWWTLKEAWLKAHGTGVGALEQSTLVNLDGGAPRCIGQHTDARSQLLELQLRPGYRTAVCLLSETPVTISCVEFS